jgi:hypothetical protein
MANKSITCIFVAPVFGVLTVAQQVARLKAIPLDMDILNGLGLSVISDATIAVVGPPPGAQRTVVLGMGPGLGNPGPFGGVAAIVTAQRELNIADNSPIDNGGYVVVLEGGGYIRVPRLEIGDSTGHGHGATAYALMGVTDIVIVGVATTPYSPATVVTASGGELQPFLDQDAIEGGQEDVPAGTQAILGPPTIVAGNITVIPVDATGGPYNSVPDIAITDTGGGSGQTAIALMGIVGVKPGYKGENYETPIVTVIPWFKVNTPDTRIVFNPGDIDRENPIITPNDAAQEATVAEFMQAIVASALTAGVISQPPLTS